MTNHYRENRAKFSIEDLLPYEGKWVAFSLDGSKILGSAPSLLELDTQLISAGENPEKVALEKIELNDFYLGAAEFN